MDSVFYGIVSGNCIFLVSRVLEKQNINQSFTDIFNSKAQILEEKDTKNPLLVVWNRTHGIFNIYSSNLANWSLMASSLALYFWLFPKAFFYHWHVNGHFPNNLRLSRLILQNLARQYLVQLPC